MIQGALLTLVIFIFATLEIKTEVLKIRFIHFFKMIYPLCINTNNILFETVFSKKLEE